MQYFANLLKDDHPAAFFLYFIESPFLLQCTIEVDLVECDPNSCVHTRILLHCCAPPRDGRCCNAFVRFNKTYQEVLLISNVFNILDILFKITYNTDFLIWVSLNTIRLGWYPGRDFFKNSRRKVVALSAWNTIKSMFIRTMFCLIDQWEYIEGLLDDTKSFSDHIHLGLGDSWRQLTHSM